MGTRNRINVQGETLARMDRSEIFIDGYHVPMAFGFTPGVDIQDEDTPVYGYEGLITSRILNTGNLQLQAYDHAVKMQEVYDILMGIDPATTGLRGYQPQGAHTVNVIRAIKHPTKDYYISAEFYPGWNTTLLGPTGDPRASGQRTFDGRCGFPIEFRVKDPGSEGLALTADIAEMDVVGSDASGSLASHAGASSVTAIPAMVPKLGGKYAVAVEIQKRDGSNVIQKKSFVTVTTGMVTSAGAVLITPSDLSGTGFSGVAEVTHAHVYFLKTYADPSGVKLLADGVVIRGRYDTED